MHSCPRPAPPPARPTGSLTRPTSYTAGEDCKLCRFHSSYCCEGGISGKHSGSFLNIVYMLHPIHSVFVYIIHYILCLLSLRLLLATCTLAALPAVTTGWLRPLPSRLCIAVSSFLLPNFNWLIPLSHKIVTTLCRARKQRVIQNSHMDRGGRTSLNLTRSHLVTTLTVIVFSGTGHGWWWKQ